MSNINNVMACGQDRPVVDSEYGDDIDTPRRMRKELRTIVAGEEPLSLSYGIEIEFMLVVRIFGNMPTSEQLKTTTVFEVGKLLAQPLVEKCDGCGEVFNFQFTHQNRDGGCNWVAIKDKSLQVRQRLQKEFPEPRKWAFVGCEINSPILYEDLSIAKAPPGQPHQHYLTNEKEIRLLLKTLQENFGSPRGISKTNMMMFINESCAFHVHVGNGMKGFTTPTVKKVLQMELANERILDSLHSATRIGGSTLPIRSLAGDGQDNEAFVPPGVPPGRRDQPIAVEGSVYNMPLSSVMANNTFGIRKHSVVPKLDLAARNRERALVPVYPEDRLNDPIVKAAAAKYSVQGNLVVVENATCLEDLFHIQLADAHGCTINVGNLIGSILSAPKMTIEFRQHAGTLDAEQVLAWVDVCMSKVRFAHNTRDAKFKDLLTAGRWLSPTSNVTDFLRRIGTGQQTQAFYHSLRLGNPLWCSQLRQQQEALYTSLPQSDFPFAIMRHMLSERVQSWTPIEVDKRIVWKFVSGGYGQWSREYLDDTGYAISADQKRKLTSGWRDDTVDSQVPLHLTDSEVESSSSPDRPTVSERRVEDLTEDAEPTLNHTSSMHTRLGGLTKALGDLGIESQLRR